MTMRVLFTQTIVCVILIGGIAAAEPPTDDLLAGPSIQDEEVTNEDMALARQRMTGKKINHSKKQQLWLSTLRSLELAEDQKVVVQGVIKEFREVEKEFHLTHGKELAKLRKEAKSARKEGNIVPENIRTRMNEIMEVAPDPSNYQEQVWVILTPDQQSEFKKKYQQGIENEKKRRAKREGKNHSARDGMMRDGGFSPKDSPFRDRRIDPMDDRYERHDDALDEASLRRIKFLRRLQHLKKD